MLRLELLVRTNGDFRILKAETMKALIVDDDRVLADVLAFTLRREGFEIVLAYDGEAAVQRFAEELPDLIVLDVNMPRLDGFAVCSRIRRLADTPIILLTVRGEEDDIVRGLELGADDYLTKPFSVMELVARVKAIFRRCDALAPGSSGEAPKTIRAGALEIDPDRRVAMLAGRPVELTAKEFDLLVHFARNPGRVYSRGQLLDAVWGYSHSGYEHTVNSHINRLRTKIEADPAKPRYILTVWSVGYKFNEDPGG